MTTLSTWILPLLLIGWVVWMMRSAVRIRPWHDGFADAAEALAWAMDDAGEDIDAFAARTGIPACSIEWALSGESVPGDWMCERLGAHTDIPTEEWKRLREASYDD